MALKISKIITKEKAPPKPKYKISGNSRFTLMKDPDVEVFMLARAKYNCFGGVYKAKQFYFYRWTLVDEEQIYKVYAYYNGQETNYVTFKKEFFDKHFLTDENGDYKTISAKDFADNFVKTIKGDTPS